MMDKHKEENPTHNVQSSVHDAIEFCLDCSWMQSTPTDSELDLWYAAEQDPADSIYEWALSNDLFNFDRFVEG